MNTDEKNSTFIIRKIFNRCSFHYPPVFLACNGHVSVQLSVYLCKPCNSCDRNYCGAGDRKPLDESGK